MKTTSPNEKYQVDFQLNIPTIGFMSIMWPKSTNFDSKQKTAPADSFDLQLHMLHSYVLCQF